MTEELIDKLSEKYRDVNEIIYRLNKEISEIESELIGDVLTITHNRFLEITSAIDKKKKLLITHHNYALGIHDAREIVLDVLNV